MSKLNVGVGEDFPLQDDARPDDAQHPCAAYWRARRMHGWHRDHHHHGPAQALGAIIIVPAAVASVTAAILYPLATLGVAAGAGLAAAAYRHGRWRRHEWHRMREEYRRWRESQAGASGTPRDEPPAPPKESA